MYNIIYILQITFYVVFATGMLFCVESIVTSVFLPIWICVMAIGAIRFTWIIYKYKKIKRRLKDATSFISNR
jgi:hypothetical protein